jgi:hypothetical protein
MSLKISELKFHDKNYRTTSVSELRALADSIERLPQLLKARPILIDKDTLTVLAGEKKVLAILETGGSELEDWQYRFVEGKTDEQQLRLLIKDNTHSGRFDLEKLKAFSDEFDGDLQSNSEVLDKYFLGNSKQIGSIKGLDFVGELDDLFKKDPEVPDPIERKPDESYYVRVPVPKKDYGEIKEKLIELNALKVNVGQLLFSKLEEFLKTVT